jgi:hypothetical protein
MEHIHYLQHTIIYSTRKSRKGIGTFSSHDAAMRAMASVRGLPGFRDPRGSFKIHRCIVGQIYYPNGYDAQADSQDARSSSQETADVQSAGNELFYVYNQSTIDDVQHDDDSVLLGYFASKAEAERAANILKGKMDLAGSDREFGISISVLDRLEWSEGFDVSE